MRKSAWSIFRIVRKNESACLNRPTEPNDDLLGYNAIQGMEYLDKVICETLRMFPPVAISFRQCTKDYQLPGGAILEKGTEVQVMDAFVKSHLN